MIRRWIPTIGVLAATLLLPASASADCSYGPAWPSRSEVRGTTFVGTVTALDTSGETNWYAWDVERVYAGDLEPGPVERFGLGPPSCHAIVLQPGTRYLVSSGYPDGGAGAFSTVAYVMVDDDSVRLASWRERPRSSAPDAYRVDTVDEALAVLLGMPPTDTETGRGGSTELSLVLVFGASAVASGFVLRRRIA